jgi:cobalamin biosynthesis Mg chelatase CobN
MPSEQEKVTKPSDNVLTPEQKPSSPVGIAIIIGVVAIGLLFASLYFGILNI